MQTAKLLSSIAFVAVTTVAGAVEVGDARKGQLVADRICAECHAVKAGQNVPFAAPTFKAIANTPGMTAMALTIFFRTPHVKMPNFVLSDDDRDDVIAYILTLRDKE
jgi:mono/diheme cytochrome c family protein